MKKLNHSKKPAMPPDKSAKPASGATLKTPKIPAAPGFVLTVFIGAFLLFQVQLLIGKYLLPWFGGGPGVWTTCMLFFQVLLLAGYAYAHFVSRWFQLRAQVILHVVLLAAALAMLPIIPGDAWKPQGEGNPTAQIFLLLAANLGLPCLVLSSTSPLLQHWFSRLHDGSMPYRLYALSNAGSLLALISYPFFFEVRFSRETQAALWAGGLVAYALGSAFCGLKLWRSGNRSQPLKERSPTPDICPPNFTSSTKDVPTVNRILWLLLPASTVALLLATTNKLCLDLAVVPFLWVLPLALYLLSFVICFDHPRWYRRFPSSLALVIALGGICWAVRQHEWPVWKLVSVYAFALFISCLVCHGELYRLKPAPRYLTGFYLMIAAGGALGGVFVAVVAPMIFTGYHELHISALLCPLLFLVACLGDRNPSEAGQWRWISSVLPIAVLGAFDRFLAHWKTDMEAAAGDWLTGLRIAAGAALVVVVIRAIQRRGSSSPVSGFWALLFSLFAPWADRKKFSSLHYSHRLACLWVGLGVLALGTALWFRQEKFGDNLVRASRNFYGVLRVFDHGQGEPPEHILWVSHGQTLHGAQFLDPRKAAWPTIYYGEESGVGLALRALPKNGRRIGLVGLGVGTLATYAQSGDYVHIFEIDPEMQRIATTAFSYLSNSTATLEITLGDARLSLEKETPQHFDLLALDAFSSDAIPVHLLTTEAFEVYERHLKTNGLIAVHISNKWLDLEPVLASVARRFNYKLVLINHVPADEQWWLRSSVWALLTRNDELVNSPAIHAAGRPAKVGSPDNSNWTDDFSSLFQILH